jgi:hypothetical protein
MVLMFADDSMPPEDIKIIKCPGVSHNDVLRPGYVVFSRTRCGNAAFYSWFLENVMHQSVCDIRHAFNLRDAYAFVSSDGEPIQIKTFAQKHNVDLLNAANIFEAKHCASFSAMANALNAGSYFRSTKAKMKAPPAPRVEMHTKELEERLSQQLAEECDHLHLPIRNKVVKAVCRVVYACHSVFKVDSIIDSFDKTGQYSPESKGMNFDKKMKCCTSSIPSAHLEKMKTALPRLAAIFRVKGFLSEEDMDIEGIPKVEDTRKVPEEQRVLHQNRAIVLNTEANLARFAKKAPARGKKRPLAATEV